MGEYPAQEELKKFYNLNRSIYDLMHSPRTWFDIVEVLSDLVSGPREVN